MQLRGWLLMSLVLALAAPVKADAPMLLNFQGRLTDASGDPENGMFSMDFAVYDAVSGGNQLPTTTPWAETQNVTVTDGVFNVLLGSVTPLPSDLFQGGPSDSAGPLRFLQISVSGETLAPRRRIVSAAYAIHGVTAVDTGPGLQGGVITTTGTISVNAPTCAGTDKLTWNGSAFVCATDETDPNLTLPTGAIILWDASDTCPAGFAEATEFQGMLVRGAASAGSNIPHASDLPSSCPSGPGCGASADAYDDVVQVNEMPSHTHPMPVQEWGAGDVLGEGANYRPVTNLQTGARGGSQPHYHPFRTVLFCRKL
jgi:hypothetical protein